jgi:hypothetical protein
MNYLKKILFVHLIIIISFLICSCGARHSIRDDVEYKDDSFSYNNLMNSKLVNGGVFSQVNNITFDDKIQASFLLSKILYEQLKDVHKINMITTGQLINEIDKDNYLIIMDNFEMEGILNNESIGFIKESIPDLDYLILAYIKNENIFDYSDTERVKNEKGEEEYKTDYEKTYLLTVEFQLYDMNQENIVYNIVVYNQADRTETRTTETGCCEGGISSIISNILYGPPAEIDREEVLAKIYEKFAEDLNQINN